LAILKRQKSEWDDTRLRSFLLLRSSSNPDFMSNAKIFANRGCFGKIKYKRGKIFAERLPGVAAPAGAKND
jgi:hypothetical protein